MSRVMEKRELPNWFYYVNNVLFIILCLSYFIDRPILDGFEDLFTNSPLRGVITLIVVYFTYRQINKIISVKLLDQKEVENKSN
tara:strand:+ start:582 stop:833 length:252 start_codon:yes stop_codon:yes gene_type:complete